MGNSSILLAVTPAAHHGAAGAALPAAQPGGTVSTMAYGRRGVAACALLLSLPFATGACAEEPSELPPVSGAQTLTADGSITCTRLTDGTARCWGDNFAGGVGDGTKKMGEGVPRVVQDLEAAMAVEAGEVHTCALVSDGSVACWGSNAYGGLGNPAHAEALTPERTLLLEDAVTLSTRVAASCVLHRDDSASCWGPTNEGALGSGQVGYLDVPTKVTVAPRFRAIVSDGNHGCGILPGAELACWGDNENGQLGDGTTESRSEARTVEGLQDVTAVDLSTQRTCAIHDGGRLSCWGMNRDGQLGDGTTERRTTPVASLSGVAAVATGGNHTCAVRNDGAVLCWGYNGSGELGDGTEVPRADPVEVAGIPAAVVDVAAALSHTCALTTDAEIYCWGNNDYGELGDGTFLRSSTPVRVHYD